MEMEEVAMEMVEVAEAVMEEVAIEFFAFDTVHSIVNLYCHGVYQLKLR